MRWLIVAAALAATGPVHAQQAWSQDVLIQNLRACATMAERDQRLICLDAMVDTISRQQGLPPVQQRTYAQQAQRPLTPEERRLADILAAENLRDRRAQAQRSCEAAQGGTVRNWPAFHACMADRLQGR